VLHRHRGREHLAGMDASYSGTACGSSRHRQLDSIIRDQCSSSRVPVRVVHNCSFGQHFTVHVPGALFSSYLPSMLHSPESLSSTCLSAAVHMVAVVLHNCWSPCCPGSWHKFAGWRSLRVPSTSPISLVSRRANPFLDIQSPRVYPALDYPVLAHIRPKCRELRPRPNHSKRVR
jgi:hypothetical protein